MLTMRNFLSFYLLVFTLVIFSCNNPYVPKEKGYQGVKFPAKKYQLFNTPNYPYQFEYPTYAKIDKEVNYFGESKKSDAWINIQFPEFNGTIYVSYQKIQKNQLDTLISDTYRFANGHASKASYMEDSAFVTSNGIHGVFFRIGGDVATTYQFFLTDSTQHFFRGALYFNTTPNEDSLAPYNAFLLKDVRQLVNSFRWKK